MILICGGLSDIVTKIVCARLEQLGHSYFLLDEDRYPADFSISWAHESGQITGRIRSLSSEIDLMHIGAIYVRHNGAVSVEHLRGLNARLKEISSFEFFLSLDALLNAIPSFVINRPRCCLSNSSKPYQQLVIRQHGFEVPRTIITNVPDEAFDFYNMCNRNVIYKSVSGIRSIVKRIGQNDLGRLGLVRNCITQFQEFIEGDNIRVHTVDDEIFATRIATDSVDYRYAKDEGKSLEMEPFELPSDIQEKCLRLTRNLGLIMAGIDLKVSPTGVFYCFEVNPAPGFIFYEWHTGQPISLALANVLIAHDHNQQS